MVCEMEITEIWGSSGGLFPYCDICIGELDDAQRSVVHFSE